MMMVIIVVGGMMIGIITGTVMVVPAPSAILTEACLSALAAASD
jgi:hypothetical protein